MFQLSALVIGFLGSFHCVAMCGPIALALSGGSENNLKYLTGRSIYNFGRITTYGLLGLIAGLLGHTLLMAGFQKSISIIIGSFMIISVVMMYYVPVKSGTNAISLKINKFIKSIFSSVLKQRNSASLFVAGLANGILPCGFVYIAMAGAAATQEPISGAGYMIMFGLGTFPAMMAVAAFGKVAGLKARSFLVKAAPVLMIILGLIFIYRGYSMKDNSCCHHTSKTITEITK
ncbi:MAG TPA: sulfite exporter TauE/SafE family protein [Bacteroidia bacterium]|nr:sulfite exporter TauE/SafE family protein [Bacteroidia bacterium]